MFYRPGLDQHGLPHDPFKAIVAPRPIGWISTISSSGVLNLAPYSYFNAVCDAPKIVMFSSAGWKDSVDNARETGEFVCNYVSADMHEKMNASSVDAPSAVSEFDHASIDYEASELVKPPRVAGLMAALECRVTQIICPIDLNGDDSASHIVFGQVIGIHVAEKALDNGRFDAAITNPVARMGYMDYQTPDGYVEMFRPVWQE